MTDPLAEAIVGAATEATEAATARAAGQPGQRPTFTVSAAEATGKSPGIGS